MNCGHFSCQAAPHPLTGSWRAPVAQVLAGRLLVCGGRDVTFSSSCYSLEGGNWQPSPDLTTVRAYAASVILPGSGVMWVTGGLTSHSDYLSSTELLGPKSHSWRLGPPLPSPLAFHCMAGYNSSHVFLAGGRGRFRASSAAFLSDGERLVEVRSMIRRDSQN